MTEQDGVVRSNATEELRRLLDERGVKWWPMYDVENGYHQDRDTEFVIDGKKYTAHEWGGTLNVYGLTPEQAIEATLGCGECHITPKFTCSECGHQFPTRNYEYYETCDGRTAYAPLGYYVLDCAKPKYCPNCGCKIKED